MLLCLSFAGLLTACGGERLRDLHFGLRPDLDLRSSPRSIPGTLRVIPLTAQGFVAGTRIVYRTAEQPLQVYRYEELLWEQVPAVAVADNLTAVLRATGVFDHVVTAADPARADYILSGELRRFEHRPTDRPPRVVAEMSLSLVCGSGRQVLAAKTYAGEEPNRLATDGRTAPDAIVSAFNRLAGRLIEQVMADVQSLDPRCGDADA